MRKYNTLLALAVIAAVPGLMLLQQFLMPRKKPAPPRHWIRQLDSKLLCATEDGFVYDRARAKHIAYAVSVYAAQGRHQTAKKWFQLGAAEFKYPSIMLFYGDYLFYHKQFRQARRWYELAAFYALKDRQKGFYSFVRQRITVLENHEKRSKQK